MDLPRRLPLAQLPGLLGSNRPAPPASTKPLSAWRMEDDDAPILRYLYTTFAPRRHLEFGTWQGFGTCLCLESCPATVWTINLPEGESKADGTWAYGERVSDGSHHPAWAETKVFGTSDTGPIVYHRTDAQGYIGRLYRERGLGHRVCQIYADSRTWDTSAYPAGFFDSVFVDGGHQPEVVASDTRRALALLRPGGLLLWHDYCPDPEIVAHSPATHGVVTAIASLLPELSPALRALVWIDPSYLLLGIKQ